MLILSRRPGDAIVIDGGIRIVVLASGQRCVRLGIEAPTEIGIVREEVLARAVNTPPAEPTTAEVKSAGKPANAAVKSAGGPANLKPTNGKPPTGRLPDTES